MRTNTLEDVWKHIDIKGEDDWLEWKLSIDSGGYGQFTVKQKNYISHRLVYSLVKGDPGELKVCHSCDNRICCNPKHLWLGTNQDNMDDAKSKGRTLVGIKNPRATLTEDQVRAIKRLLKE